jgi:hypothetical protein
MNAIKEQPSCKTEINQGISQYCCISPTLVNILIFFDLEKAFDCVNHEILLYKLEFYGITDNVYMLLKSYLQNRHQRVIIKNGPFDKS